MNIHLHIQRLVLEGLPTTANQGALVQAALESELARLLGTGGLPGITATTLKNISGGQVQLANGDPPAQTGNQIAQAVYSGLSSLGATPPAVRYGGRRRA